jgi:hypothetical protein
VVVVAVFMAALLLEKMVVQAVMAACMVAVAEVVGLLDHLA